MGNLTNTYPADDTGSSAKSVPRSATWRYVAGIICSANGIQWWVTMKRRLSTLELKVRPRFSDLSIPYKLAGHAQTSPKCHKLWSCWDSILEAHIRLFTISLVASALQTWHVSWVSLEARRWGVQSKTSDSAQLCQEIWCLHVPALYNQHFWIFLGSLGGPIDTQTPSPRTSN